MNRVLSNLNPLTEYAMLFVSAVGLYFHIRWSRRAVALGPTLLTTLGIFFCFLGIALGLSDFDPNNVKSSVPNLLGGIRTSFWVSVSGIGWALTIKIRYALAGDATAGDSQEGASIDDLVMHMTRLHDAIAGRDENSLLSQTKAMRGESNAGLERLNSALENHARHSAETTSKVLISLLGDVVRDFNTTLNEQFGENFKQLNDAVGRLVTWQSQYQMQLDRLIEVESAASDTMVEASRRYADMIEDSGAFVRTAESLRGLLGSLDIERERLAAALQSLGSLIDSASGGLPHIEKTIVEMTNQIARGVQANQESMGAVLKSSWQSIQVHNQHLSAMLKKSLDTANGEVAAHGRDVVA